MTDEERAGKYAEEKEFEIRAKCRSARDVIKTAYLDGMRDERNWQGDMYATIAQNIELKKHIEELEDRIPVWHNTDKTSAEYIECLNCDFWASEDKCAFCKGYSHFQPNDETKVFLFEKENEELKKQVENLQEQIEKMKHCVNCRYALGGNIPICITCTRGGAYYDGKKTDKWKLEE